MINSQWKFVQQNSIFPIYRSNFLLSSNFFFLYSQYLKYKICSLILPTERIVRCCAIKKKKTFVFIATHSHFHRIRFHIMCFYLEKKWNNMNEQRNNVDNFSCENQREKMKWYAKYVCTLRNQKFHDIEASTQVTIMYFSMENLVGFENIEWCFKVWGLNTLVRTHLKNTLFCERLRLSVWCEYMCAWILILCFVEYN